MYDAQDVAKWLLRHDNYKVQTEYSEGISNMKLQKLLYYAQGVYLALKDAPLFSNRILAWQHGPVVEEVYHTYKNFNSQPIVLGEEYEDCPILREDEEVLVDVYEVFGQFSAWKLRDMTHHERPWCETPINAEISQDLMKEFFTEKYIEEE